MGPVKLLKTNRSVWGFLFLGIAVRCVALTQPLIDAHLIRQCFTAAATQNMIDEPYFHLSSRVAWVGDLEVRYIQELPVYNYLVVGVHWLIGNLDLSGKLTSILLWAASFVCLQFIWRRLLNPQQTFWANLLFVTAPLGVFFGQAFMPEMLVQALAFLFVLLVLRYDESPSLLRWSLCAGIGLAALLVKLPETAHLYLILGFVVFRREGRKALVRPRYLIAAALTIAALKLWGNHIDAVNIGPLSMDSSAGKLSGYIGTWESRLHFLPWAMVGLYLAAFIAPGPAILIAAYGLWIFLRREREKILGAWLLSLLLFYLLWFGIGPNSQNYYNLPALAPLCALFGIGMTSLLEWQPLLRWRRAAVLVAILLVVLPAIPVWQYLFKQDRQVLAAALWTKANTQPGDVILFRPAHRWDMIEHPYNPVLTYYSERPTFVWTAMTPKLYRDMALERARYAIVTIPQASSPGGLLGALNRFRGSSPPRPEPLNWLEERGFQTFAIEKGFVVYRK
jgi:4-amino-4-deoxy-L-arabinose transferase-like glycosyltransferase